METSLVGDDLVSDRDRVIAGASFNYRWTRRWSLASNYEYRWIKRDNDDLVNGDTTRAKGHAIFTTLSDLSVPRSYDQQRQAAGTCG